MTEQENFSFLRAENDRLRRTLLVVVSDRKKMASQLTGVQNLGLQLQKKEQELKSLLDKYERLQGSLARAENRITQLSAVAGNGQTLAGQGAIITPGVSKKVLEALTRENTKLRQALDHLTNRGPNGVDLAVENRELHEIIMTLRDERDMKSNEVNELKSVLAAVQEDQHTESLKNQVLRLTAQNTKLERNLNAKQVFCETIVTENETLKNELQTLKDEKITRVQDLKRGLGDLARTHPEVKQIMSQVYDNQDNNSEHHEEQERLRQQIQELQNNLAAKTHECDNKQKQIGELQMEQEQLQNALQEERERLHEQLRELQDNLAALNRECDSKQQRIDELQMEQKLMQNALAGYENDFKMERQEKNKALSDQQKITRERDHVVHSYEQLKKEHIGLRQNIERMYSQAQAQQQAQAPFRRQTSGPSRTCAAQVQQQQQQQHALRPRGYGMEACADGPGDDFTDSPIIPPKETPTPTPAPRRYMSQGNKLQCPNCRKSFPHDLLENHMRDCTGDD